MKISLNWINDYVDIRDIDIDWLVGKFTVTTAEIEEVYHIGDDIVIEIDNKSLTNRPDLWCHYGIAREISAITGRRLKVIDCVSEEELKTIDKENLNIVVEDKEKCLRYSAIKINNIKIKSSPLDIAVRLTNCGITPSNLIVDLANYVMLDIGQPLHTFDEKEVDLIRVASTEDIKSFKSLDGVERKISKDSLMIWNGSEPLALAGIIGGETSKVRENTDGIILESATFDGVDIRKTASSLSIRTDASARYEKFLDTSITTIAIGRFIKLLKKYAPEMKLESKLYDNSIKTTKSIDIEIDHKYIETYLGNSINKELIIEILQKLWFDVVEKDGIYNIKVPTFRATKDITCKADIIEEILRVYGYDNIKPVPNKIEMKCNIKNNIRECEYKIKDLLVKKFNFNEIHSYSWYDNNWLKKINFSYDNALKISNSSVKQFDKLRTSLTPNLLKVIYDNRKSYDEIKIFEIGRVFLKNEGIVDQPKYLTATVYSNKDEEDAYKYIKGLCNYLLRAIKNIDVNYTEVNDRNKNQCLRINYKNIELGNIHSVPLGITNLFSSKHVINVLEINLDLLNSIQENEIRYEPISKYPETYLDFSILTKINMPYSNMETIINKFTNELIRKINYIDTYSGENVPEDMKSTTLRMIVSHNERTLQIEEINNLKDQFIKYLMENDLKLR